MAFTRLGALAWRFSDALSAPVSRSRPTIRRRRHPLGPSEDTPGV